MVDEACDEETEAEEVATSRKSTVGISDATEMKENLVDWRIQHRKRSYSTVMSTLHDDDQTLQALRQSTYVRVPLVCSKQSRHIQKTNKLIGQ